MKRRKIWILAIPIVTLVMLVNSLFLFRWPQGVRAQELDVRYLAVVELTPQK